MSDTKLRYSKQRETIYEILKEDPTHPNVDNIYMNVKKIIPDISLGTVYRNLNLLADHKRILRLDVGDGMTHFDGRIASHFHIVCNKCGAIDDIFLDETTLTPLIDKVQDECDGKITSSQILFHGICKHCLKEKGENENDIKRNSNR